jgi:ElaB/YqjD/DUF883 family membrane-anchored ribosome-binding protein
MSNDILKEQFVGDVKEVISSAEALIKATASDVGEQTKQYRSKLSENLTKTKAQLSEWQAAAKDKAVAGAKETDRVIRDHPYESIGVAFAVGLLVGFVITRK